MSQNSLTRSENIPGTRGNSLRRRLVLFMLSISLIPLIGLSIRNIQQTQQALIGGAEISLLSSAEQTANSLDAFIEATKNSVRTEAQLSDFSAYLELPPAERPGSIEEARALDLLVNLGKKDPSNIISYSLVDRDGTIALDTLRGNIGVNESTEEYFTKSIFTSLPVTTAVTYSDATTTVISFASIVPNSVGETIGVLRVKYNSNILQQVITESIGTSSEIEVLLLDQFYIRMVDTKYPELILKSIIPLTLADYLSAVDSHRFLSLPREDQTTNLVEFSDELKTASDQPFFQADITPDVSGDDAIAVAFLKAQPWLVAYSRPSSVFLADVQRQTQSNAVLMIGVLAIIIIITTLAARTLTNPIITLTEAANSIAEGNIIARAAITSSDEIGSLASAFNTMADQLQSTLVDLEQRVNDRTVDLKKSNLQLEIIAEVAREIAVIRDLQTLLNVSVNLIRERLNYYHVGIFLVDKRGEFATLQAARSDAAEKLLALKMKFPINGIDPLGSTLRRGQVYYSPVIKLDSAIVPSPLLPETISEALLPLRIRNVTIGVLDIHANESAALGEREINTLKLLADQLAAAIENAQLVEQVEGTVRELKNANRAYTQQVWRTAVDQRERPAYEFDGLRVKAVPHDLSADLLLKLENGSPVVVVAQTLDNKNGQSTLIVPLMILNQVIGVIGLEQEDPNHVWQEEEIAVAQAVGNRTAITLENARLLEEAQKRASKEQAIGHISAKIGSLVSIENIIKTTIEELGNTLPGTDIAIQFTPEMSE